TLVMAPEGISARIDEIRKLINAGILRAVSVGFHPLDTEPLNPKDPWGGVRFKQQELVETSVVSVPANPNALAIAKSLKISADTMDMVFAEPGRNIVRRRSVATGESASRTRKRKGNPMSLQQRIKDAQTYLNGLKDQLQEHLEKVDDNNVSDADLTVTT